MKQNTHGGARQGSGAPKKEITTKSRHIKLSDADYTTLKNKYGGLTKAVKTLL